MSNSDNGISFVAGALFGGLIGGLLGVLFAPRSGAETRQQLKDGTLELGDKAHQRAEEVSARGRIILDERVAQIEKVVSQGNQAGDKKVKEVQDAFDQARAA